MPGREAGEVRSVYILSQWETIEKNKYNFPVLYNERKNKNLKVQFLPTTWFIDKKGYITFKKRSWTKNLTEEFSWRIEALR